MLYLLTVGLTGVLLTVSNVIRSRRPVVTRNFTTVNNTNQHTDTAFSSSIIHILERKTVSVTIVLSCFVCALLGAVYYFSGSIQFTDLYAASILSSSAPIQQCTFPFGKSLLGVYGDMTSNSHLYDGRYIQTQSKTSQLLFNQGLNHLYGFNYIEARRNFEQCIQEDEYCAMCHFGIALSHGPHINGWMDDNDVTLGYQAITKSVELSLHRNNIISDRNEVGSFNILANEKLIAAYASRFPSSLSLFRKNGDAYYDEILVDRLKQLVVAFPSDLDILTWYAESILNTSRWVYWETVRRSEEGEEEQTLLEDIQPAYDALKKVLSINPYHPLANHLFIHITEQKLNPIEGLSAAQNLDKYSSSNGSSHLVHMPAHTYIRLGMYDHCINSSINAIELDHKYTTQCLVSYVPNHNVALLVQGAILVGRYKLAMKYATNSIMTMPHEYSIHVSALFIPPKELIMSMFKDWAAVLSLQSDKNSKIVRPASILLLRLYCNILAKLGVLTNTINQIVTAGTATTSIHSYIDNEFQQFQHLLETLPNSEVFDKGHPFYAYQKERCLIMNETIHTKIALLSSEYAKAIHHMTTAVAIQDDFMYMEPQSWTSMKLCLAAVLIEQYDSYHTTTTTSTAEVVYKEKILTDAISVYMQDLSEQPYNIFALRGLLNIADRFDSNESFNTLIQRYNNQYSTYQKIYDYYIKVKIQSDVNVEGSCCLLGLC